MLICLGDISRYLSEYDGCIQTAEKYYTMAVLLDPEIGLWFLGKFLLIINFVCLGMPLNQLGTLCGRSNSSCDAAFFYLLCLSTIYPFDGAKDNLQMLFERNEKRFIEFNKQQNKNRNDKTRFIKKNTYKLKTLLFFFCFSNREIRRFLVEFLHVTHQLLESNNM